MYRIVPEDREELLEVVFYQNPFPMWFYDIETLEFLEVNESAINRYGYSRQEFLSMTIRNIRPNDDFTKLDRALKIIGKAYEGDTIFRHLYKDGTISHVKIISFPASLLGRAARLVMVKDVSETLRLQKEREESQQLLQKVADASPTAIWMTDAVGNLVYVNQTWINWTNSNGNGDLLALWIKNIHHDDVERVMASYYKAHKLAQPYNEDLRVHFADGSVRWLTAAANPKYDLNGNFMGLVGSYTDITRIRSLEQQKDNFISTVSHELKTPITSIKGYEQLLSKSNSVQDPQALKFLDRMRVQINRVDALVRDLLDISRIETGKLTFHESEIEVNILVSELINDLQIVYPSHRLLLTQNDPCKVFADKNRVIQLITNLVDNAVKYSPGADKVYIKSACDEFFLTVSVQDFGKGISKDHEPFVFERFYQVNNVYKAPGLGIGLYLCKEIVSRCGGKIWFDSVTDHETTFLFKIPRKLH